MRNPDVACGRNYAQESLARIVRKSLSLSSHLQNRNQTRRKKDSKEDIKVPINKESVLDLYYNSKKPKVPEELLKKIIESAGLRTLDTYYKRNAQVSIVEIEGSDVIVCIENSKKGLAIKERKPYNTKGIKEKYKGEENGAYFGTNVKYLTDDEREECKLEIIDGKFYQNGKPYNTDTPEGSFAGDAIYVMSENGVIFCYTNYATGKFHHSSFFQGGTVACAGHLVIKDGELESINNVSGHYHPDIEHLEQMISELKERGVSMGGVDIQKRTWWD